MIEPTILEKFAALPDSLKTEVVHYIDFLLEKYAKTGSQSQPKVVEEKTEKHHGYGSWAGQIIMSDDFDQPLEDLKEYM
ncbi:MAG: DUF2281 domain-containing protein [Limnoraphis sp. WC205]|jgi:hypothetical protein|nr:DUF2281 domain-containing protein [Limnoraphis sp. WC205]